MESDRLDVVKDTEQVGLNGMRIRGLAQDLQEGWIRHKEKPWEDETFLLQVACE